MTQLVKFPTFFIQKRTDMFIHGERENPFAIVDAAELLRYDGKNSDTFVLSTFFTYKYYARQSHHTEYIDHKHKNLNKFDGLSKL